MTDVRVYTLCLNPSFDVTLWSDRLDFKEPCVTVKERVYPGGKAINVSRVLTKLSIDNKAYCLAGHESATRFSELLKKDKVSCNYVLTRGSIRENVLIVFPEDKSIKLNRQGFEATEEELNKLAYKIEEDIANEKAENNTLPVIVMAGSLPLGITKEMYKQLAIRFKKTGAKVVIDTDLFTLEDIKEIKPYIIKPNEVEISHLADKPLNSISEVIEFSKQLKAYVEYTLVSLGENGLLCISNEDMYLATVPKVTVKSTVGAGDTTLSAFIAAKIYEKSLDECVKFAAACGTAAVTTDGTGVITKEKAYKLYDKVTVTKVK